MKKTDCNLIGTLTKPHGYKGQMVLFTDNNLPEELEKWESVFVEIDGLLIPFFLDDVNITHTNSAIIRFEDYPNVDLIAEFIHCQVYAPKKLFKRKRKKTEQVNDVRGYKVIDSNFGELGIIDDILDYNQNLLLRILNEDKEILIPAQESIIEEIDDQLEIIYITAPEGLLEIYL